MEGDYAIALQVAAVISVSKADSPFTLHCAKTQKNLKCVDHSVLGATVQVGPTSGGCFTGAAWRT